MLQVLTLIAATLNCVYVRGYDVRLTYGNQETTENGQSVLTVPVFLLSQKRPPSPNFAPPPHPSPQFSYGKPQQFNYVQPSHNTLRRPPPVPVSNHHQEKFRPPFRGAPNHKPYRSFNKPIKQISFNQPSFPVIPPPSSNYLKATSNYNVPDFHKPVPPINNHNKQPPPPSSFQKPSLPVKTHYIPLPQSTSDQRKIPSAPPQKPYVQSSQYTTNYRPKPSQLYTSHQQPSYTVSNPQNPSTYSAPKPSYHSSTSQQYSSPVTYTTSKHSHSISPSYNQPSSNYNYASGARVSPTAYRHPSGYTYDNQVVQSPSYSGPSASTYTVPSTNYASPTKNGQYGTTEVILTEEVKPVQSSNVPVQQAEESVEDNTTVNYKVIYIPLEVLKNILTNSGLK
ncbi:uncharacterized protein [Centruroides vittatus]|uniref:uncharacterized protein n=1 Tax=Centruroides vittatus TaxID=120091 RepID=UPI0035103F1A